MQDIEDQIHERAWALWEASGRSGRLEDYWNEAAAVVLGEDDFPDELRRAEDEERGSTDRCSAEDDPEPEELDGPGAIGQA